VIVTFATHGGLAAGINLRLPPRSVDTEHLPERAGQELARLIAAARAAATPGEVQPGKARDVMSYTVLIEDDDEPLLLTASDTAMSREFSSLLEWLERHAEGPP
jgi:hypothetical protein